LEAVSLYRSISLNSQLNFREPVDIGVYAIGIIDTRSPNSSSEKGFATLYDDFDFGWAASSTSVFISTRR
jgi:hypothetical protein